MADSVNDPVSISTIAAPVHGELVFRHRLSTRLWHWVNAVAIIVLLMSGMMISNAHPHLYWGQYGANLDQPWFSVGWVIEGGRFPGWATIPSTYNLALARHWHLAFAWVFAIGMLVYLIVSLANRHIVRDLRLRRAELAPAHLWQDIKDHARLRFPTGEAALRYNVIQKTTYVVVIFILIPLLILTGLALSPGMNAVVPLPDLFGGRQSARSIHFVAAAGIAAFIVVHLVLVMLAGPYNEIRSMITGRFRVPAPRSGDQA